MTKAIEILDSLPKDTKEGFARRCSVKKVVLKNITKFTEKYLCRSLLLQSQTGSFIKKKTPTQVFSCKFCEIFKNSIFIEYPWWLLLILV